MLGKTNRVSVYYYFGVDQPVVVFNRPVMVDNWQKPKTFLHPTPASIARLTRVIDCSPDARILSGPSGWTACISPPQEADHA